MTVALDWWQLGWVAAGFFAVMFFALLFLTHSLEKKAREIGHAEGVQ